MPENATPGVWVNRVVAFLAGGLIVLAVVGLVMVAPLRSQNATLTSQLDEITNGAARLLSEARVHIESRSYTNAERSLTALLERQPSSVEAVEGRLLLTQLQAAVMAADQKWEASMGAVRSAWERTTAAALRADADAVRQRLETTLPETLNTQWEQSKDRIRRDWESGEI